MEEHAGVLGDQAWEWHTHRMVQRPEPSYTPHLIARVAA